MRDVVCSSIFRKGAGADAGELLPKNTIGTDKTRSSKRAKNRRAALDKGLSDCATSAGLV